MFESFFCDPRSAIPTNPQGLWQDPKEKSMDELENNRSVLLRQLVARRAILSNGHDTATEKHIVEPPPALPTDVNFNDPESFARSLWWRTIECEPDVSLNDVIIRRWPR
jgi:hypothetical protein